MSLAKIPLSILFALAFKKGLTPPNPPVAKSEIFVQGGLNQTWYFFNVLAIWAPVIHLFSITDMVNVNDSLTSIAVTMVGVIGRNGYDTCISQPKFAIRQCNISRSYLSWGERSQFANLASKSPRCHHDDRRHCASSPDIPLPWQVFPLRSQHPERPPASDRGTVLHCSPSKLYRAHHFEHRMVFMALWRRIMGARIGSMEYSGRKIAGSVVRGLRDVGNKLPHARQNGSRG